MKIRHLEMAEVKENGENLQALMFLTLSSKYFHLVKNVLEESIKAGNPHIITSDSPQFWEDYFEKTKWSDFFIIEPILFNLYQGIELYLKGLIFLTTTLEIKPKHNIQKLYEEISDIQEIPKEIKNTVKSYIIVTEENNLLIFNFLKRNKLNISQLYESLRYPMNKGFGEMKNYLDLHYQEGNSIKNFNKIVSDLKILNKEGTSLYGSITNTGHGSITIE